MLNTQNLKLQKYARLFNLFVILNSALGLVGCQSQPIKPEPRRIYVHGHRGSRGTHPENTMAAFKEAAAAGADIIELDLHLTKDNVLVISHDAQITNKFCKEKDGSSVRRPIYIRSLTLKEIKRYDCGSIPQARFPQQKQVPGASIPSFDEFLDWVIKEAPSAELNIETKMDAVDVKYNPDPAFFAKTLIDTLHKRGVTERSILQSFDFRTLNAAKPLDPKLRRSALFEKEKDFCHQAEQIDAQIASPDFLLATPEEIAYCHERRIQVHPWTINDQDEWKRASAMGVDGIITDYPRKLQNFLTGTLPSGF